MKSWRDVLVWVLLVFSIAIGAAFTHTGFADWQTSPDSPNWLRGLTGLLAFAFAGRVLLSFLPAGRVGSHRPRDLATTWATSHVLGIGALGFTNVALSLDLGERLVAAIGRPAALLSPWLLLLVIRLVSLPGAMVPQHDLTRERARAPFSWLPALFALSAIYLLRAVALAPEFPAVDLSHTFLGGSMAAFFEKGPMVPPIFGWASWVATARLVVYGLQTARRAPALRWAMGIVLLWVPFAVEAIGLARAELATALLLTAGAVFGIAWLRHADRRSRAISLIAIASMILTSWSGLSLAASSIAALVIFTPIASRKRFALAAGALWLFLVWPIAGKITHQISSIEPFWATAGFSSQRLTVYFPGHFAFLPAILRVCVFLGIATFASRMSDTPKSDTPLPAREIGFSIVLLLLCSIALYRGFIRMESDSTLESVNAYWDLLANLISLPTLALAAGLTFIRGEQT